jgi:hypothetical protein
VGLTFLGELLLRYIENLEEEGVGNLVENMPIFIGL